MNMKTSPALPELPDWIPWAGRPWIIAFSGGADSATLLDLAARNRSLASGIEAVYVHHHLQSIADDWEVFCRERCRELDIPFTAEHVTVDTSRGSVEAAAREARYQALSRHMLALNNPVLFVAHHQDDLLESALLALFRGSSLRGLTSMKPEKPFCNGTLARPLLSLTRRDIEEYARKHGISYVTDPTNRDNSYDRNFIRNRVTPLLKERFPDCPGSAALTMAHLAMEDRVLESYLDDLVSRCAVRLPEPAAPGLDLAGFSPERDRDTVILLMRAFLRKRDLSLSHGKLEELFRMWEQDVPEKTGFILENGRRIALSGNRIFTAPAMLEELRGGEVRLLPPENAPGTELLGQWGRFRFRIVPEGAASPAAADPHDNRPALPPEITLRFLPELSLKLRFPGRQGHTLLKNFWKENRIPACLRGFYPVWIQNGAIMGVWHLRDTVSGREAYGESEEKDERGFPKPASSGWRLLIRNENGEIPA